MIKKLILSMLMALTIITPLFSSEIEKLWGISKTDLISRLKLENYSTFKPEEKPEYSNRIIDFFSSMKRDEKAVITILRSSGKPETDYCFFNEKLYSISEEWGNIDKSASNDLLKKIKVNYTELSVEEKNPDITYSFKKNKTKVLLYKKILDEKLVQIKIFYYSTDLFNMLLGE